MNMKKLSVVLLSLLCVSAAAYAAGEHPLVEQRFKDANTSGDGHLTLAQAKTGMPRVAEVFSKIDTDNKGYITVDQLETYMDSQSQK